jgi:hypothetical protein
MKNKMSLRDFFLCWGEIERLALFISEKRVAAFLISAKDCRATVFPAMIMRAPNSGSDRHRKNRLTILLYG